VNVSVRPARADDIERVVALHLRAFPGFFLTSLGRRFLSELYQAFSQQPAGRLLVAEVNGTVAGFAAGTLTPDRFFRDLLLTRSVAFCSAALSAAIRRPRSVVPRLLSALRYRGEGPPGIPRAALLSSIAVDPSVSRSGVGTMLLAAYCEEARKHGMRHVYLTTDRDRNEPVNRFYVRHGFIVESEIRRRDRRMMIRYVFPLNRQHPSATPATGA
jgi:ribosomal protein S18 acetylase RimI-like enzyme